MELSDFTLNLAAPGLAGSAEQHSRPPLRPWGPGSALEVSVGCAAAHARVLCLCGGSKLECVCLFACWLVGLFACLLACLLKCTLRMLASRPLLWERAAGGQIVLRPCKEKAIAETLKKPLNLKRSFAQQMLHPVCAPRFQQVKRVELF